MSEVINAPPVVGSEEPKVLKRRPNIPIIIPNAENLSKEEIARLKHNEKMRRYMARKRGGVPALVGDDNGHKKTGQEIRKIDTAELVELSKDTRNLAIQTLEKKLLEINSDPEQMSKVNLATLATVFGILFDKTQLMHGLATENIAIQAKIDVNMSADKAMEELNKMREKYHEVNT